ncbi:type II toxin-antitoxin system Phd/YefM family antitoxin (plasmid) [Streptomyces sp. NBC_01136]|uniref:type II toxin-antitoxin system Phd/YefM family antitoxin n=1 Tax=Streptomyces sp. NBC_01136 TaxID=2903754 RepID=UPI0037DCFA02|nr:type II toxin-antitoxin system Phd/YefM family antitoxin [Streptomyces sp. NBC_01136]
MAETTITATKFRRDLGAVLDAVAKGKTVHVIRNGRTLCTLVPTDVYEAMREAAPIDCATAKGD